MRQCRVCGAPGMTRPNRRLMVLCDYCYRDTPVKVSRSEFERIYWCGVAHTVPTSTRNEFWDDYRLSTCTLDEYIRATVARTE